MFSKQDEYWMQRALQLANLAAQANEVPVGAVLVLDNHAIAEAYNCPISTCDPTAHAEMMALRKGAEKIDNYRLVNTTLYVTLEPCIMCAGTMVHARIKRLVYGAADLKAGAIESKAHILDKPFLNHRISYAGGLLSESCGQMLSQFFQTKR